MAPVIEVQNLSVDYRSKFGTEVEALRRVSLSVGEGEVLGVVGESGSGKTTLALAVSGLLGEGGGARRRGTVKFQGRDMEVALTKSEGLRGTGIFMIFQDPFMSLNPLMRIGEQMSEAVGVRWRRDSQPIKKLKAREKGIECLRAVRIGDAEDVMDRYPHQLSGGQNQRVMLAMAIAEAPKLLIADEPTTALDVTTQAQVLNLMKEIVHDTGMAMMYITHDLGVAGSICDRIAVLYGGMVQEMGATQDILLRPEHPYTLGLIQSVPTGTKKSGPLNAIRGSYSNDDIHGKCAFTPRCPLAHDACTKGVPALLKRNGRVVRCLNYGEEYE
jgi:oligopeptide/dipeptide ABC transporter ATP-binding protein